MINEDFNYQLLNRFFFGLTSHKFYARERFFCCTSNTNDGERYFKSVMNIFLYDSKILKSNYSRTPIKANKTT